MLIRQTALYLPAQLLGPLTQFAAMIIWTHWLDPVAFGVFALIMAMQEVLHTAFLHFWSQCMLRFLAGTEGESRRKLESIESWILAANVVLQSTASILMVALMFDVHADATLVAVTVGYTLTRSYVTHLGDRVRIDGHIGAYTVLQTIGPTLGLGVGLWFVSGSLPGPTGALAGYAVAQAVSLAMVLPRIGVHPNFAKPDRTRLKAALIYGIPLSVGGVLSWLSGNGIRFVIEHGMGTEAVGLFSVGWSIGQRACIFAAMLVTAAAFPIAMQLEAKGQRAQALEQLSLNGALLCGVMIPMAAGVMVLGRPLTEAVVAADFVDMTCRILPIATLVGCIRSLRNHFASQPFLLAQRTDLTLALDFVEATLLLVGSIVGLHLNGLVGSAVGALIAVCVTATASFWYAIAKLRMPLPNAHLIRIAGATLVMTAVLLVAPVPRGLLQVAMCTLLALLAYGLALAAMYRGDVWKLKAALRPTA